ncbi:phosphotransferase family protein [Nocardioides sp. R-C-SC26]|uniref:phosphotransferase family protein n=1 Tax=Nocardioides sp. R-C-SC26 TaxID=2870414 RepID=UPI001E4C2164|nr:phosphotransferase family protein [Nocardioides sp. R-C-SC26]
MTRSEPGSELPGLDLAAFHRWYDTVRPGDLGADLRARLIAGGKSNLTYEVTDGHVERILRRPPLGHVQATAHDMTREFTAMSALGGTAVPVPSMFALCSDDEVLGAQFYVMSRVEGRPYRTAAELADLGAAGTDRLAAAMVETLATLHAVAPDEVGLGEFGRPAGFLGRQVKRWGRQLEGSRTRPLPDADTLLARLAAHVPEADATRDATTSAIVHGDYRLDNLLSVADDERPVKAVVDWEMATIGDPLTDVALLMVYDNLGRIPGGAAIADASAAEGYPDADTQLERYAVASGRDIDGSTALGFHLGLAYLKIAVILEGIHYRFSAGQTVGDGFDLIGDAVEPLLANGLAATSSLA